MNKKTILIVEDDKDISEVLKDLLDLENYRVYCADNGKKATELLPTFTELPGLILLDLMMPIMDGYQFKEWLQNHPVYSKIPVLVMSADVSEARRKQVKIDEFLKKPLDFDTLMISIDRCYVPHLQ